MADMASSSTGLWKRRRHDWTLKAAALAEARGPGPLPEDQESCHDDEEESDTENWGPEDFSTEFFELLVTLKLAGLLTAKKVCLLSYYARGGGLAGQGSDLAVPPGRTGGFYSTHFDKVTGIAESMAEDSYQLEVPGHCKHELGRSTVTYNVDLPHAALGDELALGPT